MPDPALPGRNGRGAGSWPGAAGQSGHWRFTGCPSARWPRYWYVRVLIESRMKWTEPSTKAKFAPPVWFDLNPQVTCQLAMHRAPLPVGHHADPAEQDWLYAPTL